MKVEIVAPDLGGYEQNQDLVFKTLDKFDKYLHDFPEGSIFARVVLRPHPADDMRVQCTIDLSLPGAPKAIADAEGDNRREALSACADEIERQLREMKERREFD
ncbi:MAG: HPF/RaiA family ribosome-associated protein [Chloroflexota bacterium]|nr:HPF/RaiA family ribosome-associated protein [Chloroflexota bacterium]